MIAMGPVPTLPDPSLLVRAVNRKREALLPKHPQNLEFVLDEQHVPTGFLRADVTVDNQRHMLFATDFFV